MKRSRIEQINDSNNTAEENHQNEPNTKKQRIEVREDKVISILNDATAKCDYFPYFISRNIAVEYFQILRDTVPWENEQVIVFGKTHQVARMTRAYGDTNTSYRYSGTLKNPISFESCPTLLEIKQKVEQKLSKSFNFALLNYYENGQVTIGPHSDDERDLEKDHLIASISLGAERDFLISGKTLNFSRQISLANGSLLTMGGKMQQNYKHSVPKRAKVIHGRINITFRSIIVSSAD